MDRPVGHVSPEVREMAGSQGMQPREEESRGRGEARRASALVSRSGSLPKSTEKLLKDGKRGDERIRGRLLQDHPGGMWGTEREAVPWGGKVRNFGLCDRGERPV